jgi:crotonobetainyl-CoA:carnitine CoA-transferase CaiB-like acyl-CoA transferase
VLKPVLRDIRVVELGTYVAAPALGNMLGMLGAEVLKVEPPGGDPTRALTPWSWVSYNWNKKSLVLDLKSAEGSGEMTKLLARSDVFVESLSPRAVRGLGLSYSRVRRLNPKLIYCSIKGFASNSSSARRIGFDTIAQAEGGLMHIARGEDGRPSRVGNPCVDLTAAAFGAIEVLSALLAKPRRGAHIEVPLLDVVVYWNGYWLPYLDINSAEPTGLSSTHPAFSPYGVFHTKDGHVFVGVLADPQWERLAARLKLGGPKYSTMESRVAGREEVNAMVQTALDGMTTAEALSLLGEEVPCARVSSLTDLHTDPELRSRGVLRRVEWDGREVTIALPPLGKARDRSRPRRLPDLGADNPKSLGGSRRRGRGWGRMGSQ